MYNKAVLSLDQCQAGIDAVAAAFKKIPNAPPWTMAIVDDNGNLISFARGDGAGPLLGKNCIKKAYTSAMSGASTKVFGDLRPGESDYAATLKQYGWHAAQMGDPMLMVISGGVAVRNPADNSIMGGIGVSGLPYGPGDHDMSLIGLKAMKL